MSISWEASDARRAKRAHVGSSQHRSNGAQGQTGQCGRDRRGAAPTPISQRLGSRVTLVRRSDSWLPRLPGEPTVFGDPSFGGEKALERFAITEKWAIVTSIGCDVVTSPSDAVTSSAEPMRPHRHRRRHNPHRLIINAANPWLDALEKRGYLDPGRGGDHANECDAIERHTALGRC
jgi:hypothetical protein